MTSSNSTTRNNIRSGIFFALALALACYLAWLLRAVLLLLYVSALFAVVLQPMVRFIASWRIGRWRPFQKIAILILVLMVLGGLVAYAALALPPAIRDLQEFAKEFPARLPQFLDKLKHIPFANQIDTDELGAKIEDSATKAATYLVLSAKDWAGTLFDVAMGLILTVYFALEGERTYYWVLSFFPALQRDRLDQALRRAEVRMGRWLLGQGSLMLILGICSTITFELLHVRYAYALGTLTGLLNIIPVVGAAVSIGLTLLVAAIDSWGRVLGVGIFYLIYLNVENSILTPRIMQSSVDLPGLAILVALLIGSSLAGVVGALVSVPTAVLVAVLLDEYLVVKDAPVDL